MRPIKNWGGLSALRRAARAVVPLTLMALTPLVLSCYGRFPLTRTIYRVNGELGGAVGSDSTQHKFVQSVVMWVFVIIPVYSVSMIIDAIVFNLIEFWTGNVIQIGEHVAPDGTRLSVVPDVGGQTATMTISKEGQVLARQRLVRVGERRLEVRQEDGSLAGSAERGPDGTVVFKDAHGAIVSTLPAGSTPAGAPR